VSEAQAEVSSAAAWVPRPESGLSASYLCLRMNGASCLSLGGWERGGRKNAFSTQEVLARET
jgi:hypothetical protein